MAKQARQSTTAGLRKTVKVTCVLDAALYTRLAAGAAMRQCTHSAYVAAALEAALREQGVIVVQRRSAGPGDSSPVTQEESTSDAA